MKLRHLLPSIALASACSGTEGTSPTPAAPSKQVETSAASWKGSIADKSRSEALVLDRMVAEFSFPDSNLPASVAASSSFEISELKKRQGKRGPWWETPLPFRIPESERRFKPAGMKVFVGDEELRFTTGGVEAASPRSKTWRIHRDSLAISYPGDVASIRVESPNAFQAIRRMNWSTASADGMSEAEFSRFHTVIEKVSREGLLLPAPSSAVWSDVTLPEGATFRAWLTTAPAPIQGSSDGSEVALFFESGGKETELGRTKVPGGKTYELWTLDLSKMAGETGTLSLRTSTGPSSDYDYAFVGAPTIAGNTRDTRHVFVIGIDTLRPDHLSANGYERATSPELDEWVGDAVAFDRAWTSAPRTRPSFRAATTGRLPLDAVCAKNIGEVFDENGFATAGIVTNVHLNPRFDFDIGFDYWWHAAEGDAGDQVDRAVRWLNNNEGRDTYMFLHFMDPHIFYGAPGEWRDKFTADLEPLPPEDKLPRAFNRWEVYKWMRNDKLSDARKEWIKALYDAEIAYLSHELGRFFGHIEDMGGESIIVLHSDHGEELWDHGGFEHNHTLYDDTTRAVLWVKPPGGTGQQHARSNMPVTLQDIAPTLYDFVGFTDSPPTDGVSLLPAIRGKADTDWTRAIPIGHLRYDADRWGVVWNDHKYIVITGTGEEELYDLVNDPDETKNLAGSTDTAPYWSKLAESHGVPAGQGWRVNVDLPEGKVFTIELPQPAVGADVLDPELIVRHPVNQVWGETPGTLPPDIATVEVSEDGKTVTITGGPKGKGVIWFLFDGEVDPDSVEVSSGGESVKSSGHKVALAGGTFSFKPGIVIAPPRGEIVRMRECASGMNAGGNELDMLRKLGYVGEEGADGH